MEEKGANSKYWINSSDGADARLNIDVISIGAVKGSVDIGSFTAELRLRNPIFLCFLNTALNTVVSNKLLRDKLFQENSLRVWGDPMKQIEWEVI